MTSIVHFTFTDPERAHTFRTALGTLHVVTVDQQSRVVVIVDDPTPMVRARAHDLGGTETLEHEAPERSVQPVLDPLDELQAEAQAQGLYPEKLDGVSAFNIPEGLDTSVTETMPPKRGRTKP